MNTLISITIALTISCNAFLQPSQKESGIKTGEAIFKGNCMRCHGSDGTKGRWGAKNLKQSRLTDAELVQVITNGKGIMPSWKHSLTQKEIQSVKDYVKTLRQ